MDIAKFYHSIITDTEEVNGPLPIGSLMLGLVIILISKILMANPKFGIFFRHYVDYPLLFGGINQLTAVFVHGNNSHLYGNMFFYFLCAPLIEKKIGTINFLALFFAGPLLGGFFTFVKNPADGLTKIGASAGISALMLYFAILTFGKKIRIFNLFTIPGYLFVFPILSMVIHDYTHAPLGPQGLTRVNHWGHIGGYFAALLFYGFYLIPKNEVLDTNYIKKNYKSYLILALFPPLWFLLKKQYLNSLLLVMIMFKSINIAYVVAILIFFYFTWNNLNKAKAKTIFRKNSTE